MTVVNTNVSALAAATSMMKNTREMENAMAKLSSGLRINTASDDAAGISIADRLESQVRGLSQAIRNSQDGQNLIDTVEGASDEIVVALQRMRELAVQSSTDTNSGVDRAFLKSEAQQMMNEVDRIASTTQWNGMNVLDGSFLSKSLQVGHNSTNSISITTNSARSDDIGVFVLRGTAAVSAAANAAAENGIVGGDIGIAGFLGSKSVTTAANDSAREAAKEVNNFASLTGVNAMARTQAILKDVNAAGNISIEIGKNGEVSTSTATGDNTAVSAVKINATLTDEDDLTALRDAINAQSGTTGVTAAFFEAKLDQLLLTDHDGDDITLSNFTSTSGANTAVVQGMDFFGETTAAIAAVTITHGGTDSTTVTGEIILTSAKSFASENHVDNDYFGNSTTGQGSMEYLNDIDIGSAIGAEKALHIIDGAINQINSQRTSLGAISNRLDSVINNLTNVVENTSASESHIRDANFAQETSKLTKAQILNQAATSMLAQANASKQTVLALLQN